MPPSRKPKDASQIAPQFGDLSSSLEARKHAEAAQEQDAAIYDYDGVYDSFKVEKKPKPEDIEKRPKYFNALQKAADVRERDRQIAEERRLKRRREAEGTSSRTRRNSSRRRTRSSRRKTGGSRKRRRDGEAEDAKRNKGRGMFEFLKQTLEREDREHAQKVKAAEEAAAAGPARSRKARAKAGRRRMRSSRGR